LKNGANTRVLPQKKECFLQKIDKQIPLTNGIPSEKLGRKAAGLVFPHYEKVIVMRKKVLVVDNSPVIVRYLSHMLEKEGYEVKTAKDGLDALEIIEHFIPDTMIIDLIMPKINGEKLCRIIRKIPAFDATSLIIISAIAVEEQIDFHSFGADACIAKGPFKEMRANIVTVLDHLERKELEPLSGKIFGGEHIFARDITKELLDTKKHFEIALDTMADGFLELTANAHVIFANKAATDFFGLPEEDMLSALFPDLFSDENKTLITEALSTLDGQKIELGDDEPIFSHDRYVLIKIVPFYDRDQKFIIVLIQDITKRKQAELELYKYKESLEDIVSQRTVEYEEVNEQLQSEIVERKKIQEELEHSVQKWRTTFDTISDFVSVLDIDMRFVQINRSLAQYFARTPEELIGAHCYELLQNTHEPCPNCPHVRSIETNSTVTEEVESSCIGGTLLVTCSPYCDKNGITIGTVHVARDITRQKIAQREREKLIEKLNKALNEVKTLEGILPLCSFCKKIRDDKGYWEQVDVYIHKHSGVDISHGICPGCFKKYYPKEYESIENKKKKASSRS
jgi:PAS domain S-box-containing protein